MKNETRRKLPGLLGEIAGVAGVEAALAIAQARGGTDVYFPSRKTIAAGRARWLVEIVGKDAAQRIAEALFPMGYVVLIPRGDEGAVRLRLQIQKLTREGLSGNEIALRVGCHRRSVFRARAKLKKEGLL